MVDTPLRVIVPLLTPIMHGDEMLSELELSEPDLGAMMKLDEATGDTAQTLYTICAFTGLPPSVIRQLKLRDIRTVGDAATKMMGEGSRETGARRQPGLRTVTTGRQAS
jgi:hypothetical protein